MGEICILHVDMDAFFASVEQRDHPEWRGKPIIVGAGPHERGVVSTCSYEARRFGVHSAMPSRTAFQRCPQGIFVKPRPHAYAETSARAFEVFGRYTPFVEGVSIDEAFLDITGSTHLFGGRMPLAEKLRSEVKAACGVTCSVGLGPNRLLAKIASEQRKPDGLFEMPFDPDGIRDFLAPKPVGVLWGVGRRTNEILARYGFKTCGDLQRADPEFLTRVLGAAAAESIRAHAFGIANDTVYSEGVSEKSVSREHTFLEDEQDRDTVRRTLLRLVEEVGRRFRTEERWSRTARLKLRDATFNTHTRQAHFEFAARDDMTFRHKALELFDAEWPENTAMPSGRCNPATTRSIRLIGFGVTDIVYAPEDPEPTLFGPDPYVAKRLKRERLSAALDAIHNRRHQSCHPRGESVVCGSSAAAKDGLEREP